MQMGAPACVIDLRFVARSSGLTTPVPRVLHQDRHAQERAQVLAALPARQEEAVTLSQLRDRLNEREQLRMLTLSTLVQQLIAMGQVQRISGVAEPRYWRVFTNPPPDERAGDGNDPPAERR